MGETDGWGGALDRAITPQGESKLAASTSGMVETASLNFFGRYAGPLALVAVAVALPLLLGGYWVGLTAQAFAFAVIFLSWTLVTGEGGMLWLCQITFAGVGALTTVGVRQPPRVADPRFGDRRGRGRPGPRGTHRVLEHPPR